MLRLRTTAGAIGLGLALSAQAHAQPLVRSPEPRQVLYVLAHVDVTREHTGQALAAIRAYVAAARAEPGAVRVEAMQEMRHHHFDVIRVWRDQASYQAHQASGPTLHFHDVIAPLRGSPFEERLGVKVG